MDDLKIVKPISVEELRARYEMLKTIRQSAEGDADDNGAETLKEDMMIEGFILLINGALMIQKNCPDPDHMDTRSKKAYVPYDTNAAITDRVKLVLIEKFALEGWVISFEIFPPSGQPYIDCQYLECSGQRLVNIRNLVEGLGHKMTPWLINRGVWHCRCTGSDCQLEVKFPENQAPHYNIYFCNNSPIDRASPCPCAK
jgi:hypothetical protein